MDRITNMTALNAQNTNFQAVGAEKDATTAGPADDFAKSPSGQQLSPAQMNALAAVVTPAGGAAASQVKADTAVLLEHHQDGTFSSTLKLPCDNPSNAVEINDANGASHFFYTSRDRHVISRLGQGGLQEMEISLPGRETVGQMIYSEKEKALYVRTGDALHRIDPDKGTITATLPFGQFGFNRSIGFDADGNLLLGADKKLSMLEGSLKEKSSIDIGFRPETIECLPGGYLFCLDDSCPAQIVIFSPDGRKVAEEHDGNLYSTIMDEKSRVYFIGSNGIEQSRPGEREPNAVTLAPWIRNSIGQSKSREIVRFDPSTGETLRFKGTRTADSIIPQKNGDMLVFDDRLAEPRFINYDKDGRVKWNITFDGKGFARQFYLNEDESKAYIVMDSESCQERYLYEVNLKEESSALDKVAGSLLSAGSRKKTKLLFTEHSDHRGMIPAVLDDGRIVICSEKAIHLLDKDGKELKQYLTSSDLMKELGTSKAVNRPFRLGSGSDFRKDDRIDDILTAAINAQRRNNTSLYQRLPVERSLGGCSYNETDKTLNWTSFVDEKTGLSMLSMKSGDELKNLLDGVMQDTSYFKLVLSDRIEMPLGNAQTGNLGSVFVSRQRIDVEVPGPKGREKSTFVVSNPSLILTAIPVVTGKRSFVFAGTDDGMVHWFDVNSKDLRQSYDVGEPVKRIVAGNNTVYAVTGSGKVLTIRPKLGEDEQMGVFMDFSSSRSAVPENQKPAIVDEGSEIDIDGIKLPKHGWAHIGGLRRK